MSGRDFQEKAWERVFLACFGGHIFHERVREFLICQILSMTWCVWITKSMFCQHTLFCISLPFFRFINLPEYWKSVPVFFYPSQVNFTKVSCCCKPCTNLVSFCRTPQQTITSFRLRICQDIMGILVLLRLMMEHNISDITTVVTINQTLIFKI